MYCLLEVGTNANVKSKAGKMKDDVKKGGNYSKIHVALIVGLCYYIAAQKTQLAALYR